MNIEKHAIVINVVDEILLTENIKISVARKASELLVSDYDENDL